MTLLPCGLADKKPVLIVPAFYEQYLPAFIIDQFERYFNERQEAALQYPFVRHVLENRLLEAVESAGWAGTLINGNAPDREQLLWWSVWMLQALAPQRAWGSPRRVQNWLDGYHRLPNYRLFQSIDTELLDKLLQMGYPREALAGRRVNWHGKLIGRLELLPNAALAIKLRISCSLCGQGRLWAWARNGMVEGGWNYITDQYGHHANLRDTLYVCGACARKGKVRGRVGLVGK